MTQIEQIAEAALAFDALLARSLTQDWLRENPTITQTPAPATEVHDVRVLAAALIELFAERAGQVAPAWTADVGAASRDIFLLHEATLMPRLRRMCLEDSPHPLRRRRLFAPANYLRAA